MREKGRSEAKRRQIMASLARLQVLFFLEGQGVPKNKVDLVHALFGRKKTSAAYALADRLWEEARSKKKQPTRRSPSRRSSRRSIRR